MPSFKLELYDRDDGVAQSVRALGYSGTTLESFSRLSCHLHAIHNITRKFNHNELIVVSF